MKLCSPDCIPCCDFCIYSIRDIVEFSDGYTIDCGPKGCNLHKDEKHQEIAKWDGYCKDYHCFRVKGVVEVEIMD